LRLLHINEEGNVVEKQFPILITFDPDGETLWTSRDPKNKEKPVTLSQGHYGPRVGMPRILKLLDKYEIKSTFFVAGRTIDQYRDLFKKTHDEGHEIACHTYWHTWPDQFQSEAEERADFEKSIETIRSVTGTTPLGYRSPCWEFSPWTVKLLKEFGFVYSSNMMDADFVQELVVFGENTGLVDLPPQWLLDDAPHWLYSTRLAGRTIQPLDAVLDLWKKEFQGLYEEFLNGETDKCYVLTCHPQVIGRPSRMWVLEELIKYMRGFKRVRFVRCIDLAKEYLQSK